MAVVDNGRVDWSDHSDDGAMMVKQECDARFFFSRHKQQGLRHDEKEIANEIDDSYFQYKWH